MKFSLGMRRNNKALSFPELCALKEATDILMASPSGLANQARCAMAIKILGHNPVIKNDREYQEEIAKEELINFADLFEGIAVRPTVGRSMARYSSLVLPTTGQDVQNAELFNILNFAGLINAWALPRMTRLTAPYRETFWSLKPRVSVADVSSNLDDTDFAIHLRMFDRNYVPVFDSQALKGKFQIPRRHYSKQAWSDERVQGLLRAVKMLCREPQSVYVFTDRYEHPIVERIRSELSKDGYDLKEFRSQKPHGLEALEELVALSMFRRMILTSFSSFGHLAALIGENVEVVVSV